MRNLTESDKDNRTRENETPYNFDCQVYTLVKLKFHSAFAMGSLCNCYAVYFTRRELSSRIMSKFSPTPRPTLSGHISYAANRPKVKKSKGTLLLSASALNRNKRGLLIESCGSHKSPPLRCPPRGRLAGLEIGFIDVLAASASLAARSAPPPSGSRPVLFWAFGVSLWYHKRVFPPTLLAVTLRVESPPRRLWRKPFDCSDVSGWRQCVPSPWRRRRSSSVLWMEEREQPGLDTDIDWRKEGPLRKRFQPNRCAPVIVMDTEGPRMGEGGPLSAPVLRNELSVVSSSSCV